jgi:hypothetical protein
MSPFLTKNYSGFSRTRRSSCLTNSVFTKTKHVFWFLGTQAPIPVTLLNKDKLPLDSSSCRNIFWLAIHFYMDIFEVAASENDILIGWRPADGTVAIWKFWILNKMTSCLSQLNQNRCFYSITSKIDWPVQDIRLLLRQKYGLTFGQMAFCIYLIAGMVWKLDDACSRLPQHTGDSSSNCEKRNNTSCQPQHYRQHHTNTPLILTERTETSTTTFEELILLLGKREKH